MYSSVIKGDWTDHIQKLQLTLNKLKGVILKYSTKKYFFGQTEMEYLGFWVTRDGVKPIHKKDRRNKKYGATYLPRISTKAYRCNKLLPQYVAKAVT